MALKMTVLIPVASTSTTIGRTLESLSQCAVPDSLKSVLIVENGEASALKELVSGYGDRLPMVYEFCPVKGKSRALNHGLENFVDDDEFVVFSDDDIRFESDWLVNYERAFRQHGFGHFFGGAFEVDCDALPDERWRKLVPRSAVGISEAEFEENPSMCFRGFNWGAAKSDLRRIGFFDEQISHGTRLGATGEETLVQRRMKDLGMKRILVRGGLVWHYVPPERCSYAWLKRRSRTSGAEKYSIADDRAAWFRAKSGSIAKGVFRLCIGQFRERYRLVCDILKMRGFLEAWWHDR